MSIGNTRSIAWASTAKLHQGSSMNTRLAATKFNPTPPAFKLINSTSRLLCWENFSSTAARCGCEVDPSSLRYCIFSRLKVRSTISRKDVNWLKTTDLVCGSWSFNSRKWRTKASSFVDWVGEYRCKVIWVDWSTSDWCRTTSNIDVSDIGVRQVWQIGSSPRCRWNYR